MNCPACRIQELKFIYGFKLVQVGNALYLRNEPAAEGQLPPFELPDGTPIRLLAWFETTEHTCVGVTC